MTKLVMLGGGLDSTALIIYLRKEYPSERIFGLHVNYGQKAVVGERGSSIYFCRKYDVKFNEISCGMDKIGRNIS